MGYSLYHVLYAFSEEITSNENFFEALGGVFADAPTTIVVFVLCLVIGGFVTHLSLYHTIVILWLGMSTYESKKDHFKNYVMGNPYQAGHRRCYLLFRRRVTKFFNLREEEPLQVLDSDRRASLKVLSKDKSRERILNRSVSGPLEVTATSGFENPLDTLEKEHKGQQAYADPTDPQILEGITRRITKVTSQATARGTFEGSMGRQVRPEAEENNYGLNHTTLETGNDRSIQISAEVYNNNLLLRDSGATSVVRVITTGSDLRSE